jgi:predicted transcriptional regulator
MYYEMSYVELKRPDPSLHALKAVAMDAVWDLHEASVRDVMDAVNETGSRPRAYTTYMTIAAACTARGC